jgi:hypothetical protein
VFQGKADESASTQILGASNCAWPFLIVVWIRGLECQRCSSNVVWRLSRGPRRRCYFDQPSIFHSDEAPLLPAESIPLASPQRMSTTLPHLASPLSPPPLRTSRQATQPVTPPRSLEGELSGGNKIYPFGPPTPKSGASPFHVDVNQGLQSPPNASRQMQKSAHSPAVSSSSPRTHSMLGGRTVIKLTKIKTEGRGSITVLKTK